MYGNTLTRGNWLLLFSHEFIAKIEPVVTGQALINSGVEAYIKEKIK